jgi:hypothetical protein
MGPLGLDLPDRLDAINDGHADIEQNDMWLRRAYQINRFLAIATTPDHRQTWVSLK